MNRIKALFQKKSENIISVYFTAGFPKLNLTDSIIKELEYAGADLVEVGMPFSDPLADGPTIQQSSTVALENGMNIELLFEQLEGIRKEVSMPIILMGYLNPVMQFGVEAFCKRCAEVGVDGLIIPDLPIEEYQREWKSVFEANGLQNIFLITPQTTEDRIRMIDEISDGFIYMVSSSATTGARTNSFDAQLEYFDRVNNMGLKNPRLIGFGISNYQTFSTACKYASGVIIGSAFVKALTSNSGELKQIVRGFMKSITEPK